MKSCYVLAARQMGSDSLSRDEAKTASRSRVASQHSTECPPMGYPALSPSGSFLFWIEWSLLRLSNDAGARLFRH